MIELSEFHLKHKVQEIAGCWVWQKAVQRDGYARTYDRRAKRTKPAHRVVWEDINGLVPMGYQVDHKCTNRACVRPSHLRLVTKKQNMENRAGAQKNSKSGVLGVCWHKPTGKWVAQVRHNGRRVYQKYFDTIEEAEYAVTTKRNEIFTHNEKDKQ